MIATVALLRVTANMLLCPEMCHSYSEDQFNDGT